MTIKVDFVPEYYADPSIGRPVSNAKIYVGDVDTDPTVLANQRDMSVQEEDGTITAVSQPMRTSSGGVPTYNGAPVTILVDGTASYSLTVLDANDVQIYYVPNSLEPAYEPSFNTLPISKGGTNSGTALNNGRAMVSSGGAIVESDTELSVAGALTLPGNATFQGTAGFTAGTTINEFSIDGTLAGNSDNAVPTEKATKTYADTKITEAGVLTLFSASGDAPVFAVRAWVTFNGSGVVAIIGSGNVSSITDNGTGDYTVNFTADLPDANYAVAPVHANRLATNAGDHVVVKSASAYGGPSNKTVSACDLILNSTAGSGLDAAFISIFFVG